MSRCTVIDRRLLLPPHQSNPRLVLPADADHEHAAEHSAVEITIHHCRYPDDATRENEARRMLVEYLGRPTFDDHRLTYVLGEASEILVEGETDVEQLRLERDGLAGRGTVYWFVPRLAAEQQPENFDALPTVPCTTCGEPLRPYREPDGSCGWLDSEDRSGAPRPGMEDGYRRLAAWGDEIQALTRKRKRTEAEFERLRDLVLSYSALNVEVDRRGTHHVHRPQDDRALDIVMAWMRWGGLTLDPPRGIAVGFPDRPPWG